MSSHESAKEVRLVELLVTLEALAVSAPATRLSQESIGTMWNGDDGVGEVYFIVRHFTTDHLGAHVGLAAAVRQEDCGERHEYRLPAGTLSTEHLGVYVFNPGCRANGALSFEVCRSLTRAAVVVEPDTCPVVHTIAVADMQEAGTVVVTDKQSGMRVRLCFFFEK